MTSHRSNAFIVLALILVACAGAYAWRPTAHLSDTRPKVNLETLFPKAFGDWTIDDRMPVQLVSPDQRAILNRIYNQTLSRAYVNPQGERIMLSVAYGGDQSDGTRAHRPEVCYPAQGFQIDASQDTVLQIGGRPLRVRQLVSRLGARIEPVTYWIIVGERVALSGTEQKLAQLSYSMRGVVPDGMLVRVSSIDSDKPHAFVLQQQFLQDLATALAESQRGLVLGSARL